MKFGVRLRGQAQALQVPAQQVQLLFTDEGPCFAELPLQRVPASAGLPFSPQAKQCAGLLMSASAAAAVSLVYTSRLHCL